MNRRRLLLAAVLAFALPLAAHAADATGPQPTLPTEKLTIVTHDGKRRVFDVEVAKTPQQQETGLMFRKTVAPDGGMLFDFGPPHDIQMWMKNTIAPLDMVFINQDGTIRSIAENTVPESLATIDSDGPVRATLELAAGTTARLDIRVGDRVEGAIFSRKG